MQYDDGLTSLQIPALHQAYRTGQLTVGDVVRIIVNRRESSAAENVWISVVASDDLAARASELDRLLRVNREQGLPLPALFGIPFAVKDNIDVAGLPTTAGCPDFSYRPERDAAVVARLVAAGAILVGKTNLDQFATGLSGTRSPYGACRSPFDPSFIAGGSSSGSAVAVSAGLASFALGTDTAGSGRVPAALTNVVGIKPSRGLVSTTGVVPACRSLDCVSVFSLSVADGAEVMALIAGYDDADPYSRRLPLPAAAPQPADLTTVTIGVPVRQQWEFFGDTHFRHAYGGTVDRLIRSGISVVDVDLAAFLAAGRLLYDGPWVAERSAAVGDFVRSRPESVHPVIRSILDRGDAVSGVEMFRGRYALAELARAVEPVWAEIDALLLPTVATSYSVADVVADPVNLNSTLGHYTTFANLLDLSAVAVPAAFTPAGQPFGITLLAPAGHDDALLSLGSAVHARCLRLAAATGEIVPADDVATASIASRSAMPPAGTARASVAASLPARISTDGWVDLAVVGAHLAGLPLHYQLTDRGAVLVGPNATAPDYRLYALPGDSVRRPGLVRDPGRGASIEVEIYRLSTEALGSLLTEIPAPLGLGRIELGDGREVLGFRCETHVIGDAQDITRFGGWRAYLASTEAAALPADDEQAAHGR
ncbi:MAG: allophanate hydrolase [Actinomycetota bacterium]|nr:MAG: allophanate hydrolase [Actinomycetota bacterium]